MKTTVLSLVLAALFFPLTACTTSHTESTTHNPFTGSDTVREHTTVQNPLTGSTIQQDSKTRVP